jgi:ribonuclease Z
MVTLTGTQGGPSAFKGLAGPGPFKVPGGPLTEADYRRAVEETGFTGNTIVGTDLATVRLPANKSG